MADLFPGISAAGGAAASAASNPTAGRASIGGLAGGLDVDTKGLQTLHKMLVQVDTDLSKIDKTVKGLNASLAKVVFPGQKGGASGTPSSGLTVGSFSGSTGRSTAGAGSSTVTAAGFGGRGGGGGGLDARTLAWGAAGEIGSNMAGSINGMISNVLGGGSAASQLIAYQSAGVFGGSGNRALQGLAGINANSPADLASALTTLQGNRLVSTAPVGSRSQKNTTGIINAISRLNPSLGAAGASQFLGALTTGSSFNFFNQKGFAGNGVVVNPTTGGVNNANQVFSRLVSSLYGGQKISSTQMKNDARNGGYMAQLQSNAETNLGLSPQDFQVIQQYMAGGGSLGAASNQLGGAVGSTTFLKNAATTRTKTSAFIGASGTENTMNSFTTAVQRATNALLKIPGVGGALAGGGNVAGKVISGGLGAAGHYYEGKALLNAAKTIAGKGGGGAAEGGSIFSKILGGLSDSKLIGYFKAFANNPVVDDVSGVVDTAAEDVAVGDPMGSTTTGGLTPAMSNRINAMRAANPNLRVTSGHRTRGQQGNLYRAKGGRGAARPGRSLHELGKAADIGPRSQLGWIRANANRFGLYHPDGNEPWHVQAMGDPVNVSGAAPGYVSEITSAGRKYGVDPNVLLAVASQEGLGGGVGDRGTSFGPFQLHVNGALPAGKGQAWAQSQAGINYAVQQIAGVTRGLSGATAIASAVKNFEKSSDIPGETARAIAAYGGGLINYSSLGGSSGGIGGNSLSNQGTQATQSSSASSTVLNNLMRNLQHPQTSAFNTWLSSMGSGSSWLSGGTSQNSSSSAMGDPAPFASVSVPPMQGSGLGRRNLHIHITIQNLSGSEDDVKNLAERVSALVKKQDETDLVGTG